jgi:hypothetical protein
MGEMRAQFDYEADGSNPSRVDARKRSGGFSSHTRDVLFIFSSIILVFLIYSHTLRSPFTFDDRSNIQNNSHIRLSTLTAGEITSAAFESPMKNRPVSYLTFGLNYYIHKYDVFGYHLVNILIHATTGIFLYLFLKTTLSLPSLRSRYEPYGWIPFIAALIWLIHPIQTQSVTYIVQRMNSVAAMFFILSFFLYARARLAEKKGKKWMLFAGCAVSGLLSLGSKEIAATLPFFILLYEWYFFQDLNWSWLKGRVFLFLGITIIFTAVALVYLGASPVEAILSSYASRDFTLSQRVLTEFRVVLFYISLLLFPHPSRLNLDHDFPLSHSLVDPVTTILSIVAIVGLLHSLVFGKPGDRVLGLWAGDYIRTPHLSTLNAGNSAGSCAGL